MYIIVFYILSFLNHFNEKDILYCFIFKYILIKYGYVFKNMDMYLIYERK